MVETRCASRSEMRVDASEAQTLKRDGEGSYGGRSADMSLVNNSLARLCDEWVKEKYSNQLRRKRTT